MVFTIGNTDAHLAESDHLMKSLYPLCPVLLEKSGVWLVAAAHLTSINANARIVRDSNPQDSRAPQTARAFNLPFVQQVS